MARKKRFTRTFTGWRKAGSGKRTREGYFPPRGSATRNELKRIARSKSGVDVRDFKLAEPVLGRIARAKLIHIRSGKLFITRDAQKRLRQRQSA